MSLLVAKLAARPTMPGTQVTLEVRLAVFPRPDESASAVDLALQSSNCQKPIGCAGPPPPPQMPEPHSPVQQLLGDLQGVPSGWHEPPAPVVVLLLATVVEPEPPAPTLVVLLSAACSS